MTRRRKKKLMIISLVLVIGIGIFFIFNKDKETRIISQDQIEAVEALTMEEKLEDFEYLYSLIEENYPLLKVSERVNGFDWLGEKENFRNAIENASTDEIFMEELEKIIKKLNDTSTSIVGMDRFKNYYAAFTNPEQGDNYKPWTEIIKDEKTIKRYRFDETQLKILEEMNKSENMSTRPSLPDVPVFKSDIIEQNGVAYIKLNSMNIDRVEADGKLIREFLEEVKNYKKLIIDIRRSNYWIGDDDTYWIKNIVEPLIKEEISVDNYVLMKGDYGKKFYEYRGMKFSPISELSNEVVHDELKEEFDYFYIQNQKVDPVEPIGFNGEIYLLTDKNVVYNAENFAGFCKDTGFATVVGETTSGINHSFDNILFSLSNSGIVSSLRGLISLNGDGTIKEEVKIVPDIEVDATIGSMYERDQAIQYIINN